MRLYNPYERTVCGKINTVFKNPKKVKLNEEFEKDYSFDIEVPANKIITIEVEK